MRGTHTAVDDIRRQVFTEIARMAFEGGDYKEKIRQLPNVLSTPHVGYYTDDAFNELISQTVDVAVDLLNGKNPGTLINRELWKD